MTTLRDIFAFYWCIGMVIYALTVLMRKFGDDARRELRREPVWLAAIGLFIAGLVCSLIWPIFLSDRLTKFFSKLTRGIMGR